MFTNTVAATAESLERTYMRAENDIRKLEKDCDQGGALARLSRLVMAHEVATKLMDIMDWTDRQSLRLLTMGHFLVRPPPPPPHTHTHVSRSQCTHFRPNLARPP